MKKKPVSMLGVMSIAVIMLVSGCGGAKASTTTNNTVATTQNSTTNKTVTNTTKSNNTPANTASIPPAKKGSIPGKVLYSFKNSPVYKNSSKMTAQVKEYKIIVQKKKKVTIMYFDLRVHNGRSSAITLSTDVTSGNPSLYVTFPRNDMPPAMKPPGKAKSIQAMVSKIGNQVVGVNYPLNYTIPPGKTKDIQMVAPFHGIMTLKQAGDAHISFWLVPPHVLGIKEPASYNPSDG